MTTGVDEQLDLFAPKTSGVIRPDGLVHAVKEVTTNRGSRIITVRCGAAMPNFRSHDPLTGASCWESLVTCEGCKWRPKE